jgi:CspA family cold shock protein
MAFSASTSSAGIDPGRSARYLSEARELLALLTDGAERGYHVQGTFSVFRDGSYEPVYGSLVKGHWEPARLLTPLGEELRTLRASAVAAHLRGEYWVGVTPPSWTSWFAFDIDRPAPEIPGDVAAELAADFARDRVLGDVWQAFEFGPGREPVVISTPGRGYHVYVPLLRHEGAREKTWPAAWIRERVEERLRQCNLPLREGELELWPSGKVLRWPLGRRMALLQPKNPDDPGDLQLAPVAAQVRMQRLPHSEERAPVLRRDIGRSVREFIAAFESRRKSLSAWLGEDEVRWTKTWGPWGLRSPKGQRGEDPLPRLQDPSAHASQQYVEGSSGGWLLYGKAFLRRVAQLLDDGLLREGERHDSALKLCYYFGVHLGYSEGRMLAAVERWLRAFEHRSRLRERVGPERFVRQTLREVRHYYRTVVIFVQAVRGRRGIDFGAEPLADVDRALFAGRFSSAQVEKAALAILRFLQGQAEGGRVLGAVELAGGLLSLLCGEARVHVEGEDGQKVRTRAYKVALEELEGLGVLSLHRQYRVDHSGRQYCCWYVFGSGRLPVRDAEGQVVVAVAKVAEGEVRLLSTGQPRGRLRVELAGKMPAWVEKMYHRREWLPGEFDAGRVREGFRWLASETRTQRTSEAAATGRLRGRVESFGDALGYGFIDPDLGGPRVFVHQSSVVQRGFRTLKPGELVEYTLVMRAKGPAALWVQCVEERADEPEPRASSPPSPGL